MDIAVRNRIIAHLKVDLAKVPSSPPVDILLSESQFLQSLVVVDGQALIRLGGKDFIVNNHADAITSLHDEESDWAEARFTCTPALSSWKERISTATELRDRIWNSLEFLFHHDEILCRSVTVNKKNGTISEMIQDLSRLASIGKAHLDIVATTDRISEATLDLAEATSIELSRLMGDAGLDRKTSPENHTARDNARCVLQAMNSEIYRYGRHLHEGNPDRARLYRSEYQHQQNLKNVAARKKSDEDASITN